MLNRMSKIGRSCKYYGILRLRQYQTQQWPSHRINFFKFSENSNSFEHDKKKYYEYLEKCNLLEIRKQLIKIGIFLPQCQRKFTLNYLKNYLQQNVEKLKERIQAIQVPKKIEKLDFHKLQSNMDIKKPFNEFLETRINERSNKFIKLEANVKNSPKQDEIKQKNIVVQKVVQPPKIVNKIFKQIPEAMINFNDFQFCHIFFNVRKFPIAFSLNKVYQWEMDREIVILNLKSASKYDISREIKVFKIMSSFLHKYRRSGINSNISKLSKTSLLLELYGLEKQVSYLSTDNFFKSEIYFNRSYFEILKQLTEKQFMYQNLLIYYDVNCLIPKIKVANSKNIFIDHTFISMQVQLLRIFGKKLKDHPEAVEPIKLYHQFLAKIIKEIKQTPFKAPQFQKYLDSVFLLCNEPDDLRSNNQQEAVQEINTQFIENFNFFQGQIELNKTISMNNFSILLKTLRLFKGNHFQNNFKYKMTYYLFQYNHFIYLKASVLVDILEYLNTHQVILNQTDLAKVLENQEIYFNGNLRQKIILFVFLKNYPLQQVLYQTLELSNILLKDILEKDAIDEHELDIFKDISNLVFERLQKINSLGLAVLQFTKIRELVQIKFAQTV